MRALNDGEIGPVEEPIRDFLSPAHLARLLETWFRDHAAELVPELADELSKEAGAGRCHGDMFLAMRAALTTVAHKQQETVRGNGFDDVNV